VDQLATYSKSTQPQIKPVAQGSESDSDDLAPPRVVKSKQRVKVKVPLKKKKR
jgi:hypothetical protein